MLLAPIAIVIADTLEQASHAATLVQVTYAEETAATDIGRAEPALPTPYSDADFRSAAISFGCCARPR